MTILLFILGLFFIACGITIKYKRWLWIHQGLIKRPVDIIKYTNYMGIIDVIAGTIYIIVGIMFYYFEMPTILVFIILIIYCISTIYGEVKYRTK